MDELAALYAPLIRPALLEQARALGAASGQSAQTRDKTGALPAEGLAAARQAGLLALTAPTEYDGGGASLLEAVAVAETLAQGDGPLALIVAMPLHILGGLAATRAWPEAAFARVCRLVAAGALINSVASEREMGSPSRGGAFATLASQQTAGSWRLSGRKIFATGAPALDYALVSASLAEDPDAANGIFLVPLTAPGVTVEPTWDGAGMRAARNDDIVLDAVSLAPDDLLLRRLPGAPQPADPGIWFQLLMGAVYAGIASAARTAARGYARSRRPTALGGRAIAELESIQRQMGQLDALLLQARTLLYQCARAWDADPASRPALRPLAAYAKAQATANALAAVDQAMLIVGGASMQPDLPLERLSRDVRAGLFHPPTLDAALIGLGRAALAPEA